MNMKREHVIAATGYKPDLRRLEFLDSRFGTRFDR